MDHSESIIEDGCPQFVPAMGVKALHLYAEQTERDREDIGNHHELILHLFTCKEVLFRCRHFVLLLSGPSMHLKNVFELFVAC